MTNGEPPSRLGGGSHYIAEPIAAQVGEAALGIHDRGRVGNHRRLASGLAGIGAAGVVSEGRTS